MAIPVLCILNQENHKKRDDRRTRVDYQLPGIAESEYWPGDAPGKNDQDSNDECGGMAGGSRCPLRKSGKRR
jgi:hypothetical protein